MIQKAQNYSAYSELLYVFRITPRIQNYSTYSELLHVFRITQHIQNYSAYSLFTRASRKASPERLTFRPPVGVLSAYHALILVTFRKVIRAPHVLIGNPDFERGPWLPLALPCIRACQTLYECIEDHSVSLPKMSFAEVSCRMSKVAAVRRVWVCLYQLYQHKIQMLQRRTCKGGKWRGSGTIIVTHIYIRLNLLHCLLQTLHHRRPR